MIKNNVTNKNFLGFIEKQIRKVPLIYFLARFLIRYTNYFEEDFLILKKIFNFKKINIIDIGASDGISAKFFISNLNCNKIICYEPQVTFCSSIEKLKKKNFNIEVHNYGLGPEEKKIINYYPEINFFGKKLLLLTYCFPSKKTLKEQMNNDFLIKPGIASRTLKIKKFTMPKEKISLVKIDTNGSEYAIILALKQLIVRDKPVFIIENNNIERIYSFLKKFNYKKFISDENCLKVHTTQNNLNIIFK
jgi:FkbM family methyltransferase